ncbi:lasso RiPP family leader peptide-containing protein [Granulicella arctica]|uniref:lasso RiPP family leader peptide-containing protein n=1 Tax=Granulicella arctica TaxID=940613 RepID=UPI0021DFB6B5|nr:lasso RiPP family leader peptide-containing protein [Granulicella arctica]
MNNISEKVSKRPYSKPTVTEYGSLVESTKVFGLINPDLASPDAVAVVIQSVTSVTF